MKGKRDILVICLIKKENKSINTRYYWSVSRICNWVATKSFHFLSHHKNSVAKSNFLFIPMIPFVVTKRGSDDSHGWLNIRLLTSQNLFRLKYLVDLSFTKKIKPLIISSYVKVEVKFDQTSVIEMRNATLFFAQC